MAIHKFKTNIPAHITLKDQGEVVEGKFGEQVKYWIEVAGEDATWYATPLASDFLQGLNFTAGTVAMVEVEGGKKGWTAEIDGVTYNSWEDTQQMMETPPNEDPPRAPPGPQDEPPPPYDEPAPPKNVAQGPSMVALGALMLSAMRMSQKMWEAVDPEAYSNDNVQATANTLFIQANMA